MTRTAPPRRMILHFSHMGFTDARTFIAPKNRETYRTKEDRRGSPGDGSAPTGKSSSLQRLCLAQVPGGEDARAIPRNGHSVLEMGGERAVLGVDRPVVRAHPHMVGAHVHHRLDGEHHALLELRPRTGLAEVRNLRIFVHRAADAVSHKGADHA